MGAVRDSTSYTPLKGGNYLSHQAQITKGGLRWRLKKRYGVTPDLSRGWRKLSSLVGIFEVYLQPAIDGFSKVKLVSTVPRVKANFALSFYCDENRFVESNDFKILKMNLPDVKEKLEQLFMEEETC